MDLPLISVNIPLLPNENAEVVLKSLKKVKYPQEFMEIIIIEGNQIAKQRNSGVKNSKGKIIYLLDNDSVVRPNSFRLIAREFKNYKIAAVGGPSLIPKKNKNYLNQLIGYVLETYFGAFRMRHKWSQVKNSYGKDYNFIGANLAIRKSAIARVGFFDERIVPNEETELLRRLDKKGYLLKYNKHLFIYRNQRKNLYLLAKQFLHYGTGRMKQIIKKPVKEDLFFIVPILFDIYLISLFFLHAYVYFLPLILYYLLAFATAFKAAFKYKKWTLLLSMPLIFPIIHISYSVGLIVEFIQIFGFTTKKMKKILKPKIIYVKNEA